MTVTGRALRSLVVVCSCHHRNTEKVARAIAGVWGAEVKAPKDVAPEELARYDLVAFGSGIYSDAPHPDLVALAEASPAVQGTRAVVFSTMGAPMGGQAGRDYTAKCHARLKGILITTGYQVAGEVPCVGWNTNSFLKLLGGMHKGRPNEEDLRQAAEAAERVRDLAWTCGSRGGTSARERCCVCALPCCLRGLSWPWQHGRARSRARCRPRWSTTGVLGCTASGRGGPGRC